MSSRRSHIVALLCSLLLRPCAILLPGAIFLTCAILLPGATSAQTRQIDSMEQALKQPKDDTLRLALLGNLATDYYGYDTLKAMRYLEMSHTLAEKMHCLYYIADYYEIKAKMLMSLRHTGIILLVDTAIMYYEKFLAQKPQGNLLGQTRLAIATCKGQRGVIWGEDGKFKEAIAAYVEALQAWKQSDEPGKNEAIATYYGNISSVYYDLKEIDKALEYDRAAIPYRILDGKDEFLALAYIYVADDFASLGQNDSGLIYMNRARPFVERVNKPNVNINYFSKLAQIYRYLGEFAPAIGYYRKAIAASYAMGNDAKPCGLQRGMGECFEQAKDYASARTALLQALAISDKLDIRKEKLQILRDLTRIEAETHHEASAYTYLKQADHLSDSLKSIESKTAIAEIDAKYQTAEKEKEITRLQDDAKIQDLSIRQKSTLNYVLFGSIGGLLLLVLLLYRNYRQKQQLQQQKILEMEKDRQLMAVSAMLKGQEEERTRLARDLHDGLGGMLSGVKYSLNNMKGNLIITPDNVAVFERSLDLIDSSIRELRRVAHNMMPEMLTKFGLDEALQEYCHSVTATKLLAVQYQAFGMQDRLDGTTEIIVYRIVQELLNNILKHASATEVLVQVIREGARLSILVEDNGRGFDTAILDRNKGAGWTNIRSRVDYLKGKVDIHSEGGKGSSVTIEFKV